MKPLRIIPNLLLKQNGVVKTTQFANCRYLGDPINIVSIFNEKQVDELMLLDIDASVHQVAPHYDLLERIAGQAFMPLSYGGGITTVEAAKKIIEIGYEKIIMTTAAHLNPKLIEDVAQEVGSQAVVVGLNINQDAEGNYFVLTEGGRRRVSSNPVEQAQMVKEMGAGEIFINTIHRDGMREGYDVALIKQICEAVDVPVVACGGAGSFEHIKELVQNTQVSGVAVGSLFVFFGRRQAVLMSYLSPDEKQALHALRES